MQSTSSRTGSATCWFWVGGGAEIDPMVRCMVTYRYGLHGIGAQDQGVRRGLASWYMHVESGIR